LSKVPPTLEALVSHRNARTTFHGRVVIVQRHRAGWPQAHIAKAMGISRKCVKTWLDRYASEGEAGLHDRSSRPHSCPRRTSKEMEQRIVELRQRERRGPDWIGAELGVAARTVSRVLIRHQVPRLCMLDPPHRCAESAPRRPPRSATNATSPASWSTWTSRNSAGSPMGAVGARTAASRSRRRATHIARRPWQMR
jgi:transposase